MKIINLIGEPSAGKSTIAAELFAKMKKAGYNVELVTEYAKVKENLYANWEDIVITQTNNLDNISIDAGNNISVSCSVKLPNIDFNTIEAQSYYGKVSEDRHNRKYKCNSNGISFKR